MAASSSSPKTRPLGFDPLKIRLHTESLKRLPSLSVDEPTEIAQWLVAFEGVFSKIERDYITSTTAPWALSQRQWIDTLAPYQTEIYSKYSRAEQTEAYNEFKEWAETLSQRTCGVGENGRGRDRTGPRTLRIARRHCSRCSIPAGKIVEILPRRAP